MGPFPHDAPPAAITAQNPMGTDGFAFVEFAHPEPLQLHRLFRLMGFAEVARHRSKAVTVYRQGDIDHLINEDTAQGPWRAAKCAACENGNWRSASARVLARRTSAWFAILALKRSATAKSDHVYKGRDQDDAGCQHQDFVKFEPRNETHSPHGYPQSSTRHRGYSTSGTEAKM